MKNNALLPALLLAAGLLAPLPAPLPARAGSGVPAAISTCIKSDFDIVCEDKLQFPVRLGYGLPTEFTIEYLGPVTQEGGGEVQTFEAPVTFTLEASAPVWVYPLRYLHTVDSAPHEELIKVANSRPGVSACVDSADAATPSCGWRLDGAGNRIADSQGFCGNRDLLNLKTDRDPNSRWRGEAELGGRSTETDSFAIAHCRRENGVQYRGYAIDPPRRDYAVSVRALRAEDATASPPATAVDIAFTLTPATPIFLDKSGVHQILATLTGETRPSPAVDLSGSILYLPLALKNGSPDWERALLVPRGLVSLDGSECDKVGVSDQTFRAQAAVTATSVAGDCLANQLKQLEAADLARLAADPQAETRYLLRGMKRFKEGLATQTDLTLRLKSPDASEVEVVLSVDPARLTAKVAESDAVIVSATAAEHAALSGDGALAVTIRNTGTATADYLVSLDSCAPALIPALPPQARTVASGATATLSFDLAGQQGTAAAHTCTVVLRAPSGRLYATTPVSFATTAVVDRAPRQERLKNLDTKVTP